MIGEYAGKLIAKSIAKSKVAKDITLAAVASVAEALLDALDSTLVKDARRIKDSLIRRVEVETEFREAEVKKKIAEANKTAKEASKVFYSAELQKQKAESAKIGNQRQRIEYLKAVAKLDNTKEIDLLQEIVKLKLMGEEREKRLQKQREEAQAEFYGALSQFNLEGGEPMIDSEKLKIIIARASRKKINDVKNV
ncbi:MAG TPA: hypothetical protein VG347_16755 [Verrucomicrobiae bacterium]|nr:hypothetical protein [Verrucomicrobiae bacterium]